MQAGCQKKLPLHLIPSAKGYGRPVATREIPRFGTGNFGTYFKGYGQSPRPKYVHLGRVTLGPTLGIRAPQRPLARPLSSVFYDLCQRHLLLGVPPQYAQRIFITKFIKTNNHFLEVPQN